MKPWLVLTPALGLMAALVAGAFALDSVRAERARQAEVDQLDTDLAAQEKRLLAALDRLAELPRPVTQARVAYQAATNRDDRQARYTELATMVQREVMPSLDVNQPADRLALDELAGAINRREVVSRRWDELAAEYRAWQATLRGRWAARLGAAPHRELSVSTHPEGR